MTTRFYSSVVDHSSDAGFRAWGSELSSNLQAAGLVQTADTGQINWATATRPGVANTDAGYEIYKLNDGLFATAPIYIRINYGSASTTSVPRMTFIAGTGTNGAGTITGTGSGTTINTSLTTSGSVISTTTPYATYICVKTGFVGIVWKANGFNQGGTTSAGAVYLLSRTCDNSGAITTIGFHIIYGLNGGTVFTKAFDIGIRTLSPASNSGAAQAFSFVPGTVSSSINNGNLQVYGVFMRVPTVASQISSCVYVLAEINIFTTFSTTLFGYTPHTYLTIGQQAGQPDNLGSATYGLAMLWE